MLHSKMDDETPSLAEGFITIFFTKSGVKDVYRLVRGHRPDRFCIARKSSTTVGSPHAKYATSLSVLVMIRASVSKERTVVS